MRSGSEKIRGSRWCVFPTSVLVGLPDLTGRFSQPTNEWRRDTAALCPMPWCVLQPLFILSSALSSFFQYILSCFIAGSIPLLFLFVLVYIPSLPFCYAGFARFFTHRYQSSCITYASGLLCSQYPLFFSFLRFCCLWCEDIIMFSLYLSVKVDYRPNQRPVICTELTYSR